MKLVPESGSVIETPNAPHLSLTLLVQNDDGYRNLLRLISKAEPVPESCGMVITERTLHLYSKGLIALVKYAVRPTIERQNRNVDSLVPEFDSVLARMKDQSDLMVLFDSRKIPSVADIPSTEIAETIEFDWLRFYENEHGRFQGRHRGVDRQLQSLCRNRLIDHYSSTCFLEEATERLQIELQCFVKAGYSELLTTLGAMTERLAENGIPFVINSPWNESVVCYLLGMSAFCPLENRLGFGRLQPELSFSDTAIKFYMSRSSFQKAENIFSESRESLKLVRVFAEMAFSIRKILPNASSRSHSAENRMVSLTQLKDCFWSVDDRFPIFSFMDDETLSLFPIEPNQENGHIALQWDASETSSLGIPYFCFWPDMNLAIIAEAIAIVQRSTGQRIRIDQIPLDCQETFALIRRLEHGQFSTWGASTLEMIKELQPDNLSDLFIVSAVSRLSLRYPDQALRIIATKFENPTIEMDHPLLLDILGETYGCIVYRGQARMLMRQVGNFTEDMIKMVIEARRTQNTSLLQAMQGRFASGAIASGIDHSTSNQLWLELSDLKSEFEEKAWQATNVFPFYVLAFLVAHYSDAVWEAIRSVSPAFYRSNVQKNT